MAFHIIGDIHGHAADLIALLAHLGYRPETVEGRNVWAHWDGTSRAVFVGDFIDRGPEIRRVLHIVRAMVEHGTAFSVLGNHEYNAIGFATRQTTRQNADNSPAAAQATGPTAAPTPDAKTAWLRHRTDRHLWQHIETLYQFRQHRRELQSMLRWFRRLPLFLEFDGFRVAHAAWLPAKRVLTHIPTNDLTDDAVLQAGGADAGPVFEIIETILKGPEVDLPAGAGFCDKDGTQRFRSRTRWWDDPTGKTFREVVYPPAMQSIPGLDDPIPSTVAAGFTPYDNAKPLFLGHYWLDGTPTVTTENICVLDFSVAKGGRLVAYTWDGEHALDSRHLVWAR